MSNVLKNKRGVSELEFYHNATLLRQSLTQFVMNDKNIPKSYRFVFTFPMTKKLIELFDNITAANTVYPKTEHEVEIRRDYQTKAVITCEQIYQLLQYAISVLPINANRLLTVIEQLDKEIALLKAWRKTTKIL